MMVGLATETMVEATRIMKKPTSMAHRAFHGFGGTSSPESCAGDFRTVRVAGVGGAFRAGGPELDFFTGLRGAAFAGLRLGAVISTSRSRLQAVGPPSWGRDSGRTGPPGVNGVDDTDSLSKVATSPPPTG